MTNKEIQAKAKDIVLGHLEQIEPICVAEQCEIEEYDDVQDRVNRMLKNLAAFAEKVW